MSAKKCLKDKSMYSINYWNKWLSKNPIWIFVKNFQSYSIVWCFSVCTLQEESTTRNSCFKIHCQSTGLVLSTSTCFWSSLKLSTIALCSTHLSLPPSIIWTLTRRTDKFHSRILLLTLSNWLKARKKYNNIFHCFHSIIENTLKDSWKTFQFWILRWRLFLESSK